MPKPEFALQHLGSLHGWPEQASIAGVEPFTWALDGGGRQLIDAVISAKPTAVLVEIGSFMGGAARRWLSQFPDLRCICIDPWRPNLVDYVARLDKVEWAAKSYGVDTIRYYAELLREHGPLRVVQNNLAEFQERCFLVQMGVPEAFEELAALGLHPDIVFLDAMKRREEFEGADTAFPDAIICGDDWSWKDDCGNYPVRRFAADLAARRRGRVFADRATFVIDEPRHGLVFDKKYEFVFEENPAFKAEY